MREKNEETRRGEKENGEAQNEGGRARDCAEADAGGV
jgi:hypothetical protein